MLLAMATFLHYNSFARMDFLGMNGFPWDSRVVHFAGEYGHLEIADWAIANGCPDLDVEDGLDFVCFDWL
jgi:hypothetical protein